MYMENGTCVWCDWCCRIFCVFVRAEMSPDRRQKFKMVSLCALTYNGNGCLLLPSDDLPAIKTKEKQIKSVD